ncbi:MAG: alpha/beta fold hydrolase [Gammaproteobacteria bacterium]|nr:alpha/beta fold hydrolase [Gammaproteobacteria bacterium]
MNVVLLHGWGLNSAVWDEFVASAIQIAPSLKFHPICMPGYGENSHLKSCSEIKHIATWMLNKAPEKAVWLGWSLGGMIAVQAAAIDNDKCIRGLYLMATSPCFVQKSDWELGVPNDVFNRFADELGNDYKSALTRFLLLQAGFGSEAKALAKKAQRSVCKYPAPKLDTLKAGIDLLEKVDLRGLISQSCLKDVPSHVLSCSLDRVANPRGGVELAKLLGATSTVIKSGHAPFLSRPADVISDLLSFCDRL